MFWKCVILWDANFGHVDQHKIAAFGVCEWQVEFKPDGVEEIHLRFEGGARLVPKAVRRGELEPDGDGFLEGRDRRVADAGVGCCYVGYEVGGADEPAYTPAGHIEGFASLCCVSRLFWT